jgi:subtilisin family serine protease
MGESASAGIRLAGLDKLVARSRGSPRILVGLVDGPVATNHTDFADAHFRTIGETAEYRTRSNTEVCRHGTFVAGILVGRRGRRDTGICPDCTLVNRPIFGIGHSNSSEGFSSTPEELADGIKECVDAGVQVLNVSATFCRPSLNSEPSLEQALDYAAQHRVVVVAAAGNQATVGTSAITRHPAVVPVAAADSTGRIMDVSNIGSTIGRRGLIAPGVAISLNCDGGVQAGAGTSAAAPFVTGTIALLLSIFPTLPIQEVRAAVEQMTVGQRHSVVPPPLNAEAAYQVLLARRG